MSDLLFWGKGSGKSIASFPTLSAHPQASISKEIRIPRPTYLSFLCIPPHLHLPSSFIAAFVLETSPLWIFICLKADQIIKCSVAVVKVNRYRWMKKI